MAITQIADTRMCNLYCLTCIYWLYMLNCPLMLMQLHMLRLSHSTPVLDPAFEPSKFVADFTVWD